MKRKLFVLLFAVSVITLNAQVNTNADITTEELKGHVETLASEEFAGRKPGTDGDKKSADYINTQLKALNLTPLCDNGYQSFDVITSLSIGENQFKCEDFIGEVGKDYLPISFSGNNSVLSDVVFVGYGLSVDEENIKWNDYANIDVKGKIVLIMRGAPVFDSAGKFNNYSSLIKKAYTAKDKGAVAVLFVTGEMFDKEDLFVPLTYEQGQNSVGIPVIQITRNSAELILKYFDISLEAIEANINEVKAPNSFEVGIKVFVKSEVIKNKVATQNIVYLMKGEDPVLSDEYIVIGAHYDHLGMGGKGTGSRVPDTLAVHYGADDNASGVAAIIEIIEKLKNSGVKLKRSIIIAAFSGEEMGLLGSKYFVNNPPVELNKIKLMFNLDMVGRLNEQTKGLSIGGVGTAENLKEDLEKFIANSGLNAKFSPEGYGPSDHASFYSKNIPVLFLFTGIHDDYHTPRDNPSKINYEGEKSVCELVCKVVENFANRNESLVYKESGPKEQPETRKSFKVTLGIMPDVASSDIKGLRADAVIVGRPAYKAGMLKGDIIISMDGKPVNDIYEYMNRLQEFKVGQRITVEVLRNNEKVLLIVEL